MSRILAWHFLNDDGLTAAYNGSVRVKVEPRQVLTVPPPVKCCINGLHGSVKPLDALSFAPGGIICRVKIGGQIDKGVDKLCGTTRECLWMLTKEQGESCLRAFARWCAIQAIIVSAWDAPAIVKKYLTDGKETDRAAAWDAAWAAAWVAARAVARDAANKQLELMLHEAHEGRTEWMWDITTGKAVDS